MPGSMNYFVLPRWSSLYETTRAKNAMTKIAANTKYKPGDIVLSFYPHDAQFKTLLQLPYNKIFFIQT